MLGSAIFGNSYIEGIGFRGATEARHSKEVAAGARHRARPTAPNPKSRGEHGGRNNEKRALGYTSRLYFSYVRNPEEQYWQLFRPS